jgi:hypothetical protein
MAQPGRNGRTAISPSLVLECEETLKLVEEQLDRFFGAVPGSGQ